MPDHPHRVSTLFQRYLDNSISHDEYLELLSLLNPNTLSGSLTSELKNLWLQAGTAPMSLPGEVWDNNIQSLIQKLEEEEIAPIPLRKISLWYKLRWAAAAVFLVALSSGIYYSLNRTNSPVISNTTVAKIVNPVGVLPGGNKAVLILADGTSIVLDSTSNGTIAKQGATRVTKLNSGQLVYNLANAAPGSVLYNTLSTPRGGQYQVTLSDGTVVWLNSGSSLRYPTAFTGADRTVEIRGEAYFEVTKNAAHPFKVKINLLSGEGGEVEVLGTHFNINAYEDETTVRTTLLEGSVKVKRSTGITQITPGQQLQVGKLGQIKLVNNADLEEAIAWKEGRFYFENADINSVMRQLARWYDIEVQYNATIPRHFDGNISRNVNVLKVLNMLELTGEVNFKVEGRKVIIMP